MGIPQKPVESVCSQCHQGYIRHPRSKKNLCCTCRRGKKNIARVISTHDLAHNAIQSDEELQEYLSHDELECLICGGRYSGLYAHIRTVHALSVREYKIKYGIPVTCGLVGANTKAKMQLSAKATTSKMAQGGYANLAKGRANRGSNRIPWTEYHRKAKAENMLASPDHPSKLDGTDIIYCKACGGEVYVPSSVAPSMQCRVLCPSCKETK